MRFVPLIISLLAVQLAHAQAQADLEPIQHEYIIKNFKTESGTVLPQARIVYGTYEKLNAKGDNTILLVLDGGATYGHGIVRLEGEIAALTADPTFHGGDYKTQPTKGIEAFSMFWAGWLFSQQWWRQELWRTYPAFGKTFEEVMEHFRGHFIPGADSNNLILQMRSWELHDVGKTPAFHGDVEAALRSIKVPTLAIILSLWGHPAGAGIAPADGRFLNEHVSAFLAGIGKNR